MISASGRYIVMIAYVMIAYLFASCAVYGESLPDPTRPADYSARTISRQEMPEEFVNWDVRAIKSSESGRIAIVNGRIVRIGDEIDSAKVVDITPGTVVLDQGRKQLVLRLMPEDYKKKHLKI